MRCSTMLRARRRARMLRKHVPAWVRDAQPSVIARFVDAAVVGDGWIQRGHRAYATTSRRLADDMQELFIKLGRSATIRVVEPRPCRFAARRAAKRSCSTTCTKRDHSALCGKATPASAFARAAGSVHGKHWGLSRKGLAISSEPDADRRIGLRRSVPAYASHAFPRPRIRSRAELARLSSAMACSLARDVRTYAAPAISASPR